MEGTDTGIAAVSSRCAGLCVLAAPKAGLGEAQCLTGTPTRSVPQSQGQGQDMALAALFPPRPGAEELRCWQP